MEDSLNWSRKQTWGEEIANTISHAVGLLAAVAITPVLIINAFPIGTAGITGATIFGVTMILLYLASTLYHAFPHGKTKKAFQTFDHCAIFLLIAGTYTPFTLSVLPDVWGWSFLAMIWILAVFGVLTKCTRAVGTSKFSIAMYLGMGWLAVLVAKPFYDSMPGWSLIWLLLGGAFYTSGVLFFAYDHRYRYNHFIWHLFVLAGTASHVMAVLAAHSNIQITSLP
jgi:hemolysin III